MNFDISKFYEIIQLHKKEKIYMKMPCIFFLFYDYTVLYKYETAANTAVPNKKGHPYENIFQSERYT